ncbi:MAG: hypothetical protein D6807_05845 [Alphaproteobacteria bacterium]|nr:MAG: hypothetical protein D6807_05845 [Alphaproteobacteria bacterium]
MSKLKALARRELIENRNGIVLTPVILMGLMLILVVGSMSFGIGEMGLGHGTRHVASFGQLLREIADAESGVAAGIVIALMSVMSLPALMVLPVVIFFVLLGGLYEERRDRSFLFWKSMPVSDTEEVLARLAGGIVLTPAVFLAVGIATHLLTLVLASLIGGAQGGPVGAIWYIGPLALNWFQGAFVLAIWMLWALPVFAWVLLASAYAPRTPFLYAVVPPIVVIVNENVFLHSNHFASWIGRHLSAQPLFEDIADGFRTAPGRVEIDDFSALMQELAKPDFAGIFNSFAHPDLWIGLAIAAALLYGTVWLRRYALA